jgi:asparagine synthase (glutamine-hydrolysing)
MSGICGVCRQGNPNRIAETLHTVTAGLSLHLTESAGYKADSCAGVGISARFSTQQIYENPNVLIACDATLYNEKDLHTTLGSTGQTYQSETTGALLAALYERFGCDFVQKLRGAFSIILWDRRERKLVAAIDGFGIGRLSYYGDGKVLLVSSRVDALGRAADINTAINPAAIANLLNFSSVLAPQTIFTGVNRLAPGTMLIGDDRHIRLHKYWDMHYAGECDSNERSLARKLESLVEESVSAHCKADPLEEVGAFLSGGTDSSTVVGMMSRLDRGPVKTFSIGFEDQQFNELGYAQIAANKFKAKHHTYLVGSQDCFEAIPHIARCFDEPYGNSSAIPTYFCARLAAQNNVTVLLAGDGGDELFGGNERYLTDKIFEAYQAVPSLLRKLLIEPVLAGLPVQNGLVGTARRYVRRSNLSRLQRFFSYNFLCAHEPADVFEKDFLATLGGHSVLDIPSAHYNHASARDHLDRLLYVDMKITLADNDLLKVTRMSELAGVQSRFPFLDRDVAEFSGSIPPHLKVKGSQKRYLFKQAFRELLPIEIVEKKKHGFGIPVATWMKSDTKLRELSQDILRSARAFERGYFKRAFIEELFRRHGTDDTSYYGDTIWTFLALELWHRQCVDQPAGSTV